MGYSVRFFRLNWDSLIPALNGERMGLLKEIPKGPAKSILSSGLSRGLDPMEGLRELLGGDLGRKAAARGPEPAVESIEDLSPGQALAWLALTEHLGVPAGQLVHNSKAGPAFRDHFLEVSLPAVLGPFDWYLLVDRPLFGLTFPGYPTWGGLRAAECADFLRGRDPGDVPEIEDPDEQEWLEEVYGAIESAHAANTDLITQYY